MIPLDAQQILAEAERLGATGQYRAALALLDTLTSSSDDPVRAGLLRGRILVQQGQFDAAIDHWRAVQAIHPENIEIKQALELAMRMKDQPARFILLRANLHIAIQYVVILLLAGMALLQAGQHTPPTPAVPEQSLTAQIETMLHYFHEENERQESALEKRMDMLEKAVTAATTAILAAKADADVPIRAVAERLTALEQAIALERESVHALGARQEERITALGMVIGEMGTHLSPAAAPIAAHPSQTPVSPTH